MNIVSSEHKTTLLLNNAWQPINTISARAAFTHLLKGNVTALDKNGATFNSLSAWNSLAEYHSDQPAIRSAKQAWPIPTIIVVTSKFFRRPKKLKLSVVDLAKIHNHTCQYCLQKFPLSQLTIDHVFPKSKGGQDVHENRVLACHSCNTKKSSITPWYDINGKIPKPPEIPAVIVGSSHIRKEWLTFISQ